MGKPRVHLNAGPVGVSFGLLPAVVLCGGLFVVGLIAQAFTAAFHDWHVAVVLGLVLLVLVGLAVFTVWWHRRELRRLGRR